MFFSVVVVKSGADCDLAVPTAFSVLLCPVFFFLVHFSLTLHSLSLMLTLSIHRPFVVLEATAASTTVAVVVAAFVTSAPFHCPGYSATWMEKELPFLTIYFLP